MTDHDAQAMKRGPEEIAELKAEIDRLRSAIQEALSELGRNKDLRAEKLLREALGGR